MAIFRRKDERILNHQTTQDWQGVFLHFDRDRSGSIDGNELQAALAQFGYRLSPQLLNLVQRKYGAVLTLANCCLFALINIDLKGSAPATGGYHAAAPPGITFDRFVRACVVVKQITETFVALDTDRDGWVQINYDKFLQTVLTLP